MRVVVIGASLWLPPSDLGEGRHAELRGDGSPPESGLDLGDLVLGAGQADL
jgi:hypothetical protein